MKQKPRKKLLIFPEWNFLIFWEMELVSPKLKQFLVFQEGTCKARNFLCQNHQ